MIAREMTRPKRGLSYVPIGIVDDNPAKHGTFSPGTHLEVRPSDDLYAGHPDGVVVLSWRYAEPIMARHRRYAEQGGRFIHVWPDVRV